MNAVQNIPVVTVVDGNVTTLSTDVATFFEKEHSKVIRSIENIIATLPQERLGNFSQTVVTRANPSGGAPIKSKAYRLTRDGFTFLAMGFTGERAQAFKWAYIDAFNKMEETLRGRAAIERETITPDEQLAIQLAVAHRAQKTSKHFQTIYRAIKVRYQIAKYDQLPRAQFEDCLRFIESVDLSAPAKIEPPANEGQILVSSDFIERMRVFVYYWRYLFRDDLERVHALMESLQSPLAPHFWEAVHSLNLQLVECDLEKLGYPVKELKCYKYWLSQQPA